MKPEAGCLALLLLLLGAVPLGPRSTDAMVMAVNKMGGQRRALWSRRLWRVLAWTLCVLVISRCSAQVLINEVLADNLSALENDGGFPDWVELYNLSASPVLLNDWTLTDNTGQPAKFVFPAGTTLPAGGFLLVYCDGATNAPGLHASFNLSDKGEWVALYHAGVQQDLVVFGLQLPDVSIGRSPDGSGGFGPNRPTPLAANQPLPFLTSTNLKINEWMGRPAGNADDWFELYNPENSIVELGGLVWSDRTQTPATNRALATLSFIGPGGFIQFLADDLDSLDFNHVDFALGGGGDRIILYASDRTTEINRVDFGNQTNDVSEGRLPDGSTNRVFFAPGKATPAASNFQLITEVFITEVLTHTDLPLEDAIELSNPTANPVDISHWWLSNSKDDPRKFRIPAGTTIAPGGYKVFYEYRGLPGGFNPNGVGVSPSFTLNSARGDKVFLHTGDAGGNLGTSRTSRSFGPAENGVSFGRYLTSEGKTEFVAMSARTLGADRPNTVADFRTGTGLSNAYPKVGPVVISELMYHPPDLVTPTSTNDNSLDEYIELYNLSRQGVPLFDPNVYPYPPFGSAFTNTWRVRGEVDFDFPTNVMIGPGEYLLVVNFSPTNAGQMAEFRARYGVPAPIRIVGPYKGKLSNSRGSVELHKPDPPQAPDRPDAGLVPYVLVEEVNYKDDGPWPAEPDGRGAALHRLKPEGYADDPIHWTAQAPDPGQQKVRILSAERSGNAFVLRFTALAGSEYAIECRHSLGTNGWTQLTHVPASTTTGIREVIDLATEGSSSRFYRVVTPTP